jgi:serine/threonine-protein kinase
MALTPGTRLGVYEVTALLGVGGMGEVYRATDTNLKRAVAIKVLPEPVAADAERLARFQREAEILAALNHPNIAAIYGLERSSGVTALVMELVEGPTLADRIAAGAIPVDEALPIAKQIAEALEAAHEQGIIHRDLKPANIKVRPDGTVKVLDFGLAKAIEPQYVGRDFSAAGASQSPTITTPAMTQMGMILGTAAYMSPEQARGRPVDKKTDIWAFGCVVFEMLAGHRAFPGEDVTDTLAAVVKLEPDWRRLGPDVPSRVRQALRVCLQKDPRQRGGDITAIRLALEGAFDTSDSRVSIDKRTKEALWRRTARSVALFAGGGLVVGLILWGMTPAVAPRGATRFDFGLPEGQQFATMNRSAITISPDGRSIAHITSEGVLLRSLDGLDARLITGTEGAGSAPVFSPDGQALAYIDSGQLKRIPVGGGPSVVVAPVAVTTAYSATWAPDDTILFTQPEGILRVAAAGGTPRLIVRVNPGQAVHGPQLLPDGDSVLFSVTSSQGSDRWDSAQIVIQSLSTGERAVVLEGGSDARYLSSGHLVYALQTTLFAVPFDIANRMVRGAPSRVAQGLTRASFPGVNTGTAQYEVSSDGTLVFITDATTEVARPVWVTRRGEVEPIPTLPSGTTPRLSPDDTRVLLEVNSDLWIYELESGRSSRFTRDGVSERGVWDPTGARVAYTSSQGTDETGIQAWITSVAGGDEPRQITRFSRGRVHVDGWSPDGRAVLLHQHTSPTTSLFVVPTDVVTSDPPAFLKRQTDDMDATFSPDGRFVAYRSLESGTSEIQVRPYPGPGGQQTVSVGGGQQPVWKTSGELFYRDLTGERMMSVSISTSPSLKIGTPRQLFQGTFFNFLTGGSQRPQYDVTRDGQRFLMLQADQATRPRIVVVQDWDQELTRLVPIN